MPDVLHRCNRTGLLKLQNAQSKDYRYSGSLSWIALGSHRGVFVRCFLASFNGKPQAAVFAAACRRRCLQGPAAVCGLPLNDIWQILRSIKRPRHGAVHLGTASDHQLQKSLKHGTFVLLQSQSGNCKQPVSAAQGTDRSGILLKNLDLWQDARNSVRKKSPSHRIPRASGTQDTAGYEKLGCDPPDDDPPG